MKEIKFRIQHLGANGDCAYYRREWTEPLLKRFICINTINNEIIAEFRTFKEAQNFAYAHGDLKQYQTIPV